MGSSAGRTVTPEESRNLKQLSCLIDLCQSMGMQVERDNSGQLVLYTGTTDLKRDADGEYSEFEENDPEQCAGIGFLTDAAVEACDFH